MNFFIVLFFTDTKCSLYCALYPHSAAVITAIPLLVLAQCEKCQFIFGHQSNQPLFVKSHFQMHLKALCTAKEKSGSDSCRAAWTTASGKKKLPRGGQTSLGPVQWALERQCSSQQQQGRCQISLVLVGCYCSLDCHPVEVVRITPASRYRRKEDQLLIIWLWFLIDKTIRLVPPV